MGTSKERAQERRLERLKEKLTEVGVENHKLLDSIKLQIDVPELLFHTRLQLLLERLFPHKFRELPPSDLLDLLVQHHCTTDGTLNEESYLNFELDVQRRLREKAEEVVRRSGEDVGEGIPSLDAGQD